MTTPRSTTRHVHGTIAGHLWENDHVRVRVSTQLTLFRENDGSWLAFSDNDQPDEDGPPGLTITDPAACAAFDALFELIADPLDFEERTIGETTDPDRLNESEVAKLERLRQRLEHPPET